MVMLNNQMVNQTWISWIKSWCINHIGPHRLVIPVCWSNREWNELMTLWVSACIRHVPCAAGMVKSRIPRMKRVVFQDAKLGRAKTGMNTESTLPCVYHILRIGSNCSNYGTLDALSSIRAHPGTSWELQSMASTGGGGNPSLRLSPKTQAIGFFLVPKSKSMEVAENKCWRWHGRGPATCRRFMVCSDAKSHHWWRVAK